MSNTLKTKLYILGNKILRKNERGSFYISIAYVQEEKTVKHVSFPQVKHLESTLEKGKYYLCTNVGAIGDTVRLTDSSKVFQISSFALDHAIINSYMSPTETTVEEILQSPIKRMVSVKGILRKSSQVIESPNSKRRELTIESMEGPSRVVCKLWGDHADKCLPDIDEIVTICNVEVATFKDIISLNSTLLTCFKESHEDNPIQGEVEGIDFREDFSYIIIRNESCSQSKTYKIRTQTLEDIFPESKYQEDIHVQGTAHGLTIIELTKINPAKKSKLE